MTTVRTNDIRSIRQSNFPQQVESIERTKPSRRILTFFQFLCEIHDILADRLMPCLLDPAISWTSYSLSSKLWCLFSLRRYATSSIQRWYGLQIYMGHDHSLWSCITGGHAGFLIVSPRTIHNRLRLIFGHSRSIWLQT